MTQEEFDILIQEWLTEHGQELSQSEMSDEEFNRKLVAALQEMGFSEANVADVLSEIDDHVFMTGVEYSTDDEGNPVTPLRYIRAKMRLWQGQKGDQGPKGDKGDWSTMSAAEKQDLIDEVISQTGVTQEQFDAIFYPDAEEE